MAFAACDKSYTHFLAAFASSISLVSFFKPFRPFMVFWDILKLGTIDSDLFHTPSTKGKM